MQSIWKQSSDLYRLVEAYFDGQNPEDKLKSVLRELEAEKEKNANLSLALEDMEDQLHSAYVRVDDLEDEVQGARMRVDDLQGQLHNANVRVDDLEHQVEQLEGEVGLAHRKVQKMEEKVDIAHKMRREDRMSVEWRADRLNGQAKLLVAEKEKIRAERAKLRSHKRQLNIERWELKQERTKDQARKTSGGSCVESNRTPISSSSRGATNAPNTRSPDSVTVRAADEGASELPTVSGVQTREVRSRGNRTTWAARMAALNERASETGFESESVVKTGTSNETWLGDNTVQGSSVASGSGDHHT